MHHLHPRSGKVLFPTTKTEFSLGKWEYLHQENVRKQSKAVILATGERSLIIAFKVLKNLEKQGKSVDIVNARFVKPLDVAFLQNLQSEHVITIEDNMLIGGFGAMVNHTLSAMDKPIKIKNFAYEDAFIPQGKVADLQCEFGVSCEKIENYLLEVLV